MKPAKNATGSISNLIRMAALLVCLSVSLLPSISRAQQSAAPRGALVLDWYNKDHPWNVKFDPSFQSSLQSLSAGTVECYFEYLESNRFPGEKQYAFIRTYLMLEYAEYRLVVVLAV